MTYYNKENGQAYTLNARETAPSAAREDMFKGDSKLSVYSKLTNVTRRSTEVSGI